MASFDYNWTVDNFCQNQMAFLKSDVFSPQNSHYSFTLNMISKGFHENTKNDIFINLSLNTGHFDKSVLVNYTISILDKTNCKHFTKGEFINLIFLIA